MLAICLFGTPRIEREGSASALRVVPKAVELLGYLAAHAGTPVPRETLRDVLWPDSDAEPAFANLRRHLHLLVRALPPAAPDAPYLLTTFKTVQWNAAAAWCDVVAFEAASRDARRGAEAIAAYGGDFLAPHHDEWILLERERMRSVQLGLLRASIRLKRGERDLSGALEDIARALAIDPWREDAVRAELQVRAELGDRSGALAAYRTFAERVRAELDVDPMPETQALYERLLRGDRGAPADGGNEGADNRLTERITPKRSLPFRGRATEFGRIARAWDAAAHGAGGIAFVGGEAGIGKSRLLAELALHAEGQGGRAFVGTTSPGEPHPYEPVVDALRAALPLVLALDRDSQRLGVLAMLLPDLALRGRADPPPELSEEGSRVRLFDAVADTLQALARNRPLLIVLEDLHWAGAATLALVEHVSRRLATHAVLVVATNREEEVNRAHPLRAVRRRLERDGIAFSIALERLSRDAVVAIARDVLGDAAASGDAAFARSEGLPLLLEEALRAPDAESGSGLNVSGRLERLDDAARALVEIAAVAGVGFDVDVLRDLSGWSEADVLRALDALVAARFVREPLRRARTDFVFAHHLIHAAVYDGIAERVRSRRHASLARLLADAPDADDRAGEIATHFERAGDVRAAARAALAAARRASALFANEEALALATHALALIAPGDEPLAHEIHLQRLAAAAALVRHEQIDEELRALDAVANLDTRRRIDVEIVRAHSLRLRGDDAGAERAAACAVELAQTVGDARTLALATLEAGRVAMWAGRYDAARDAMALVEAVPLDDALDLLRLRLASWHASATRGREAMALARAYLGLAERTGDVEHLAEACGRLAGVLMNALAFDDAERYLERGTELGMRLGLTWTRGALLVTQGNLAMFRGRYAAAEGMFREGSEAAHAASDMRDEVTAWNGLALLAAYRGDAAGTFAALARSRSHPFGPDGEAVRSIAAGLAHGATGDLRAARTAFDDALALLRAMPSATLGLVLGLALLAALDAGDAAAADALDDELGRLEARDAAFLRGDEFPHVALWARASHAAARGDAARASAAHDEAVALYRAHLALLAGDEARAAYAAVPWNARFLATVAAPQR